MLCYRLGLVGEWLQLFFIFFFQAEDGIRDAQESRGLGDVYKRQTQYGGDSITTPTPSSPSRFFNNGGFVVRAGVFTGLRLYASDSGGAIKMFSSLINRINGSGSGGVIPLDIGAAPVIQLRASVRSKDSVNAVSYTHLTLPTKRIV
eukprot:TRINITY_DN13384_c0_g1_i1.p1 TRINITY_DN13384_c0_g1~~TRINITY_DN13384_c0_g1_i1.p1  ORF type:complete len:147 (+),score=29.90 TRINITY_DN13384_c0_g1_i1:57-497(+)